MDSGHPYCIYVILVWLLYSSRRFESCQNVFLVRKSLAGERFMSVEAARVIRSAPKFQSTNIPCIETFWHVRFHMRFPGYGFRWVFVFLCVICRFWQTAGGEDGI